MKKQVIVAISVAAAAVCYTSAGCNNAGSAVGNPESAVVKDSVEVADAAPAAGESTLALYGLKKPVKSMKEWMVDLETISSNPNCDFKSSEGVKKALEAEVLDEMSTSVKTYEFTPDGKVDEWVVYSGDTPAKVRMSDLPGIFDVTFENGVPKQFRLDQKAFQDAVDKGEMFLDAYEKGFEEFTVQYGSDGMPASIKGLSMGFFGGGEYSEQYADYKFDNQGNWISRKVTTPYLTYVQFREYEY